MLGEFLRARRGRVSPTDVGLPAGSGLRRTPGLRREELAVLAGVSIDYYTRLEQGKETHPSPSVIDALARALRLDADEHAHLRALSDHAGRRSSQPRRTSGRTVRPTVLQLLETVLPSPAYVLSQAHDVLAANSAGLRLLAGIDDWPAKQRNTIRFIFLHPSARSLFADWDQIAKESIAHLRSVAGADPDDSDVTTLVGELIVKSEEFAKLWDRYDVRTKSGGKKSFHHGSVGDFTLSYEVLDIANSGGQKIVIYQAVPGTRDHDAMMLLAMADTRA